MRSVLLLYGLVFALAAGTIRRNTAVRALFWPVEMVAVICALSLVALDVDEELAEELTSRKRARRIR